MPARFAFISLGATALLLAAISLAPAYYYLYTSPWVVALWGVTALAAACAIVRSRLWKKKAVFLLHVAFLVILAGALITHIFGASGQIHLRVGESRSLHGSILKLEKFDIEYYPATSAPSDFIATININGGAPIRVSMNRTADTADFRLFLSACDADRSGCTLTVARDRIGTAVSYIGYLLLLLSMLAISIKPRRAKTALAIFIFAFGCASAAPKTIPRPVADELGNLYVYHNDRVAPLSTLARDFTLKIYGSDSYQGLSPEQVLAGWLFFYDNWKTDPGIKIKDKGSRSKMGIHGNRARLTDFFGTDGYLFDAPGHDEANEKFALVSGAATGSTWKLFPHRDASPGSFSPVIWYSPVDQLPTDLDIESWRMVRHSFNYLAELVAQGDWQKATDAIRKIGKYQRLQCPELLPSQSRVKAERLFLKASGSLWQIILLLGCGIILLLYPKRLPCVIALVTAMAWLLALICLNAYASRHLPMGNGYETMQWMALFALASCLWLGRKHPAVMPLGILVAAAAIAVALMGQRNPQLTNLMPVLRSPLLSIHVLAMMLAYALLAVIALISAMWLSGKRELLPLARILLRPAVFLLAAGIFIGAVWANMSWGRYWGWDPKETWALITMITYSFPLHTASLPLFRRDRPFAIWTLASLSTLLVTYLGVNLLPGLHSYA